MLDLLVTYAGKTKTTLIINTIHQSKPVVFDKILKTLSLRPQTSELSLPTLSAVQSIPDNSSEARLHRPNPLRRYRKRKFPSKSS